MNVRVPVCPANCVVVLVPKERDAGEDQGWRRRSGINFLALWSVNICEPCTERCPLSCLVYMVCSPDKKSGLRCKSMILLDTDENS